ncbi:hypothetical protein AWENTII_005913 [Aspergillus wentii]
MSRPSTITPEMLEVGPFHTSLREGCTQEKFPRNNKNSANTLTKTLCQHSRISTHIFMKVQLNPRQDNHIPSSQRIRLFPQHYISWRNFNREAEYPRYIPRGYGTGYARFKWKGGHGVGKGKCICVGIQHDSGSTSNRE